MFNSPKWTVVHQVFEEPGPAENFEAHFHYKDYAMKWIRNLQRLGADRLALYKEQRDGTEKLSRKWGAFEPLRFE